MSAFAQPSILNRKIRRLSQQAHRIAARPRPLWLQLANPDDSGRAAHVVPHTRFLSS